MIIENDDEFNEEQSCGFLAMMQWYDLIKYVVGECGYFTQFLIAFATITMWFIQFRVILSSRVVERNSVEMQFHRCIHVWQFWVDILAGRVRAWE